MASTLNAKQSLLTKAIKRLDTLLQNKERVLKTEPESPTEPARTQELAKSRQPAIKKVRTAVENEIRNVEKALNDYTRTADELHPTTPTIREQLQRIEANTEKTVDLLDNAANYLIQLQQLNDDLEDIITRTIRKEDQAALKTNLPPIPIPKFSGEIREWEAFWGAFDHSVHSCQMDDLLKMNYLLDALIGDAKEYAKQYEISQKTYSIVIERLKKKYGDRNALTDHLLNNLYAAEAQSNRLEDQEKLCETLHSVVIQLRQKGEFIDTMVLQKLLIGKFTIEVQWHARRQRRQLSEHMKTEELLTNIKEFIDEELELRQEEDRQTTLNRESRNPQSEPFPKRYSAEQRQLTNRT